MSLHWRPARKIRYKQDRRLQRNKQLTSAMSCDSAFRAAAYGCLQEVIKNQDSACDGDIEALHCIRINLTRLRTLASFFSPIICKSQWLRLKRELKWLNGYLGAARDMDVLMVQFETNEASQPDFSFYAREARRKWISSRRRMTRAIGSQRYQQLIKNLLLWIEDEGRATTIPKKRDEPVAAYAARRLSRWQNKVLKKSQNLGSMDLEQLHSLRIATKRLRYAIEFFGSPISPRHPEKQKAMLKHLRNAQEALGSLNDAARIHSLMSSFAKPPRAAARRRTVPFNKPLDDKEVKQLLRQAASSYREMEHIKAF